MLHRKITVWFFAKIDQEMWFEEASRIGTKLLFIKIAGVFDITGTIAVLINQRHAVGMELITPMTKIYLFRVKSFTISWKTVPITTETLIRNISSVNRLFYQHRETLLFRKTSIAIARNEQDTFAFNCDHAITHFP